MSDSKLDFPAGGRRTSRSPAVALDPHSKLDLPGTLQEFNALAGKGAAGSSILLRSFTKKESAEAIADAAGVAVVNFGAPFIGWTWRIERMVVLGSGSVKVYVGGRQDSRVVDLTASGSADVADEAQPIYVEEGELVEVVFTGATVGGLCTVNAQIVYNPGN